MAIANKREMRRRKWRSNASASAKSGNGMAAA
jgi:hypothetical protein